MLDLRQIPRWQIGEKGRLKFPDGSWESKCRLEDLNLKGFRLSLKDPLPPELVFDMRLEIENLVVEAQAKMHWKLMREDRYYYGFEITRIKDAQKKDISDYLFKYHQEQFKAFWWPKKDNGQ